MPTAMHGKRTPLNTFLHRAVVDTLDIEHGQQPLPFLGGARLALDLVSGL